MKIVRNKERNRVISFVKITSDFDGDNAGRVIDIHSAGLKIRTRRQFQKDEVLTFSMMIPNINFRRKVIEFEGSIMWSQKEEKGRFHESGIKLVSVAEEDREIIEQFIADASHRNRWIHVNECFAQEH